MIRSLPLLLIIALACITPRATAQEGGVRELVGAITLEQLLDQPGWFGEEFLTWAPNMTIAAELPARMKDVHLLCVLGTWCGDSRREVPRLLRLMQLTGLDPATLTLYGVDRAKRSPDGEERRWGIERVPTIIVLRGETEIGRIIESPTRSLEADLLGILDPTTLPPPPPPAPPAPEHTEEPPPHEQPAEHVSPDGSVQGTGDADRMPANLGVPGDTTAPPADQRKPSPPPAEKKSAPKKGRTK